MPVRLAKKRVVNKGQQSSATREEGRTLSSSRSKTDRGRSSLALTRQLMDSTPTAHTSATWTTGTVVSDDRQGRKRYVSTSMPTAKGQRRVRARVPYTVVVKLRNLRPVRCQGI